MSLERIVFSLCPFDVIENQHIQETLSWIRSGAPLYRIQKPDVPPKHLVSYFVVWDEKAHKILLVDHKKAQLWLPSGGHVEEGEDPKMTVERECMEELSIKAEFWRENPIFLTVTPTVGLTAGHIDVSLWYVLKGNSSYKLQFDIEEFNAVCWFGLKDIPFEKSDPHMERFINKFKTFL